MRAKRTARGLLLASLLALTLGSCVQDSRYRPVDRGLDSAFVYSERGRDGKAHAISDAEDPDSQKASRVPTPGLVDIDSTLVVRVDPEWGAGEEVPRNEEEHARNLARKAELTLVAKQMDALTRQRQEILARIEARGTPGKPGQAVLGDFKPLDEATPELAFVFEGIAAQAYGLQAGVDPDKVWYTKKERESQTITDEAARNAAIVAWETENADLISAFQDSDEMEELNIAREKLGYAGRQALLNREIERLANRIAESDRLLERAVTGGEEGDKPMIRLQADLQRPGSTPVPLHLRGYDNLDEGQLLQRDRAGLNLSETERKDLAEQMEATQKLSSVLEDMRTREISIQTGLLKLLETADPELHVEVVKLEAALKELESKDRLARLEVAAEKLEAQIKTRAGELQVALPEVPNASPEELVAATYKAKDGATNALEELVNEVKGLRTALDQPQTPESVTGILLSSAKIAEQARALVKQGTSAEMKSKLEQRAEALKGYLKAPWAKLDSSAEVASAPGGEPAETPATAPEPAPAQDQPAAQAAKLEELWGGIRNSAEARTLEAELRGYSEQFQIAKTATIAIYQSLAPTEYASGSVLSNPTHVFDIPADELRDTSLDLTRVDSKPGDRIVIRAQQREGDKVVDESEASFEITRYGWYGRLSPSIVLVKPTSLANGGETFQFAPALSWNQHYRPRPSQDGFWNESARFLEPAIGIHAAFLPYDSVNGIAIGMGATVSFWEDHLQVGGGYNLMASNSGEGEFYYFIGSDLIGLLQALNIGD